MSPVHSMRVVPFCKHAPQIWETKHNFSSVSQMCIIVWHYHIKYIKSLCSWLYQKMEKKIKGCEVSSIGQVVCLVAEPLFYPPWGNLLALCSPVRQPTRKCLGPSGDTNLQHNINQNRKKKGNIKEYSVLMWRKVSMCTWTISSNETWKFLFSTNFTLVKSVRHLNSHKITFMNWTRRNYEHSNVINKPYMRTFQVNTPMCVFPAVSSQTCAQLLLLLFPGDSTSANYQQYTPGRACFEQEVSCKASY